MLEVAGDLNRVVAVGDGLAQPAVDGVAGRLAGKPNAVAQAPSGLILPEGRIGGDLLPQRAEDGIGELDGH